MPGPSELSQQLAEYAKSFPNVYDTFDPQIVTTTDVTPGVTTKWFEMTAIPSQTEGVSVDDVAPPNWEEDAEEHYEEILKTKKEKRNRLITVDFDSLIKDMFGVHVNKITQKTADEFVAIHQLLPSMPYRFSEPKNLIGIEVEAENILKIDLNIPLCFWHVDVDNSLRNNGREFRSVPLHLKYAEPALIQLFNGLNDTIEFSSRTSVHIHLDVRNLTVAQTLGLLFTYTTLENLLFKFCGTQRRNNIFCVPITETNLYHTFYKEQGPQFLRLIESNWSKYTALNLVPIKTLGTVEFRHMPGTKEIKKLLIWIDILNRIKTFAYRYPLDVISERIQALNTNSQYRQFVYDIIGDLIYFLDLTQIGQDMENGVYIVKNCSVLNQFQNSLFNKMFPTNTDLGKCLGLDKIVDRLGVEGTKRFDQFIYNRGGSIPTRRRLDIFNGILKQPQTFAEQFGIPLSEITGILE